MLTWNDCRYLNSLGGKGGRSLSMVLESNGAIFVASFQIREVTNRKVISCLLQVSNERFSRHNCRSLFVESSTSFGLTADAKVGFC